MIPPIDADPGRAATGGAAVRIPSLLSRSVLARTVALVCAPLLAAVVLTILVAITYSSQDARRALVERAQQTVALLAGGAGDALWNVDRIAAAALLAPLLSDPDFAEARIIDSDGTVFYRLGRTEPARERAGEGAGEGFVVERVPLVRIPDGGPPVTHRIGTLDLHLTTDRAEHTVLVRGTAIAAIGLGLLVMVCGVLAVLITGVTRPIRAVTESMAGLAAGRVDVPLVTTKRQDELGRMAAALGTLKQHAIERLGFLERQARHVEEVERTVAERTAALRDALDTLERAQDELVRSEKLAALGGMVAAIAHEINTPLGNALTVATTLADHVAEFRDTLEGKELRRSAIRDYSDSVATACGLLTSNLMRAADLIGRFKRVAVDQTGEQRRLFDLDTACAEIIAMIRPSYKHAPVAITLDLPSGVVMDSYPGALGQVLTNLVSNAMTHAFAAQASGTLRVAATLDRARTQITLVVADDGVGIPPEILPRVFDPFFTTKLGSGGSGLGLHIVYAIVTRVLGGSVAVHSQPGVGTRFTLVLPTVAPTVAPADTAPVPAPVPALA